MSKNTLDVVFHVGLGKTASTYLQDRFFPKLKGIYYLPTNRYHYYEQILAKEKHERYLVSREFDRQFEREVTRFAKLYPQAKIIIVLRRNDSWMASQYRRHVKNGLALTFKQFIDAEDDNGYWKLEDARFLPKLQLLEKLFEHKPLVLFHDELKENPYNFLDKIAQYADASYSKEAVSLEAKHKSYNSKQLKYVKKFAPHLFEYKSKNYKSRLAKWITFRPKWFLCHLILWTAPILPDKWVDDVMLVEDGEMEKLWGKLADDWEACKKWAAEKGA